MVFNISQPKSRDFSAISDFAHCQNRCFRGKSLCFQQSFPQHSTISTFQVIWSCIENDVSSSVSGFVSHHRNHDVFNIFYFQQQTEIRFRTASHLRSFCFHRFLHRVSKFQHSTISTHIHRYAVADKKKAAYHPNPDDTRFSSWWSIRDSNP